MRDSEYPAFTALLDDVAALLPPSMPLTGTARAMFFRALSALSVEQVRSALDAHVRDPQRGRFFPKPADVLAQITAPSDGRPGADEAWAIAVKGRDEAASVVWTDEIAEAWGISKPVLDLGDEVGARVAFRDAYGRIVAQARQANAKPQWFASLGHDPEARQEALREEARITGTEHLQLPAPRDGDAMARVLRGCPAHIREQLARVRLGLTQPSGQEESEDVQARERTAQLKNESAAKVAAYEARA